MKKDRFKKKEGFTLNELIIVLSIIGIIMLISVPAFRTYSPALKLSGATRELVSDLRYSEQLALNEQINHGIHFIYNENKYQLIKKYAEAEEVLEEKFLPPEVSFYSISGFIDDRAMFNPYGAALEPGTIILNNINNSMITIEVKSSGFVKIID